MKIWFLFSFLMYSALGFAADGGVTIGNGGDASTPQTLSLQQIERLTFQSKSVLVSLVNTLDLQAGDKTFTPKNPAYYAKLFGPGGTLVEMISATNLNVFKDQSCLDLDGSEKDASAALTPKPRICVSALRLQNKINSDDAFIKLGGLLAHEFSHLAGTSEPEAADFQQNVEALLAKTSLDQGEKFQDVSDGSIDYLRFLYEASLTNDVAAKDWKTACEDANMADEQFATLLPSLKIFSRYNSRQYSELTANYLRHKLIQSYICTKAGVAGDEMHEAALELIFGQDPGVFLDTASIEGLFLLGIIYDLPKTHTYISKIDSDENLEKLITALAGSF